MIVKSGFHCRYTINAHDPMGKLILQKFSDDVANSLLKKDGMHKLPKSSSSTNGKIFIIALKCTCTLYLPKFEILLYVSSLVDLKAQDNFAGTDVTQPSNKQMASEVQSDIVNKGHSF